MIINFKQIQLKKALVHVDNPEGHRQAYVDLLTNMFGFSALIQPVSRKTMGSLIATERLIFATVGKHFRRHLLVCIFRAVLNRPTATMFLGASDYYYGEKRGFDRIFLKLWKFLPKQQLFAIISYEVFPALAKITNDYIYDPQLWDVWVEKSPVKLPETELSREIEKFSKNRKILLFLGKTKKSKSYNEFVDFSIANKEDICAVSAGKVLPECTEKSKLLKANDMVVIDRFISDEELWSLYSIGDFIWCYYGKQYDQSSGVYGRAIQLGKPTIIRKNSVVDKISNDFQIPAHVIDIEDPANYRSIYENIKRSALKSLTEKERKSLFENLCHESISKLKEAIKQN